MNAWMGFVIFVLLAFFRAFAAENFYAAHLKLLGSVNRAVIYITDRSFQKPSSYYRLE